MIIDLAPRLFAPKGDHARSELGAAFQQYFEQCDPKRGRGSALSEARRTINAHYGLTSWNQGRLEVGVLLGILANTIPAIFYLLVHILSDPMLLQEIREELESACLQYDAAAKTQYLKILTMREKCVILHSSFQEVLRVHALGSSVRYVREDIILQDQYLLKKGMVVQMPMAVMHSDPSSWGTDVDEFQPRRFLKLANVNNTKEGKSSATAYRPFGGGASLCPGRHFVTLEAMAVTASFILRFDAVPVDGGWRIPAQKQESMATNVFPPERDIRVDIRERQGYEGVKWDFVMA